MKRDVVFSIDLGLKKESLGQDTWVLKPEGSIDSSTSNDFKNHIDDMIKRSTTSPHLLLDMSKVRYISSMGLGTLLGVHRRSKQDGSFFALYDVSLAVKRVLEISKLDFLILRPDEMDPKNPFASFVRKEATKRSGVNLNGTAG